MPDLNILRGGTAQVVQLGENTAEAKRQADLAASSAAAAAASAAANANVAGRVNDVSSAVLESYGLYPALTGSALGAGNYSLVVGSPAPFACTLENLQFHAAAVGSGMATMQVVTVSGSNVTVIASYSLPTITSTGLKSYTSADFGTVPIAAGQQIQISSPSGGAQFANSAPTGAVPRLYKNPQMTSGSASYATNPSAEWQAGYRTTRTAIQLPRGNMNSTDSANLATLATRANEVAALDQLLASETDSYGLTATGGGFGANYTLLLNGGRPVERAGTLASLALPIDAANGAFKLMVLSKSGGSYAPVQTVSLTATSANTVQTYTSADFGTVTIAAGQYLAVASATGGASFKAGISTSGMAVIYATGVITGPTAFNTNSTQYIGGTFTVALMAGQVEEADLGTTLGHKLEGSIPAKPVSLLAQQFGTSAPGTWTFTGTWTHPGGGALPPSGSGKAQFTATGALCHERRTDRWVIVPQTSGAAAWFGTYFSGSGRPSAFTVNGTTGLFGFATSGSTWGTTPTVTRSVTLPTLTAGRRYLLELKRDRRVVTATLTDLVTGAVVATISDGMQTQNINGYTTAGYLDGSPWMQNVTGQMLIESFDAVANIKAPLAVAIGDSRTAVSQYACTEAQRWTALARDAMGGSLAICAIDGTEGRSRIAEHIATELPALGADWVIEFYGTNDLDANVAAYTAALNSLDTWCQSNGKRLATVILPPATGRSLSAINAAKLAMPARVRKVRFDLAITTGNDGVTADNTLNGGNELHPGPLAQAAMYQRLRVDLPELFQ